VGPKNLSIGTGWDGVAFSLHLQTRRDLPAHANDTLPRRTSLPLTDMGIVHCIGPPTAAVPGTVAFHRLDGAGEWMRVRLGFIACCGVPGWVLMLAKAMLG